MLVVTGLGNPGKEYVNTRHNLGLNILIDLIRHWRGDDRTGQAPQNSAFVGPPLTPVWLLNPTIYFFRRPTYVNETGRPIKEFLEREKINHRQLWVIHDDTEIPFGKIRIKFGGNSGGHNGIKSIDEAIGRDYWRVKIGIGRPQERHKDLAKYVLENFTASENKQLPAIIDRAVVYLVKSIEDQKLEAVTFNAKED